MTTNIGETTGGLATPAETTFNPPPAPATTEIKRQGHLEPSVRSAYLDLLTRGVVFRRRHPESYQLILRWQADIRTALADLELEMQIDERYEMVVLVKQEVPEEDDDSPVLIRSQTLTLYDTLVLLVLRSHFRDREMAGDLQVYFALDQLIEWLLPFKQLSNKGSIERTHVRSIVDRLVKPCLVLPLRGEDDRWEISPSIRLLVNFSKMARLLEEYKSYAAEGGNRG